VEIDVLARAIDMLVGDSPDAHADDVSVETLHRLRDRLDAYVTRCTAVFDAANAYEPDGARTAAAWIATRCSMSMRSARREVRRGRAIRDLPECHQAWTSGEIAGEHVDVLVGLSRRATEEALGRDEKILVDAARSLRFESFQRVAAYWEQMADPDGTEHSAEERRGRRQVNLGQSFEGMWFGKITLDPLAGSIVAGELARIEETLFTEEWAEARERLGREPRVADLLKSPAQRRADALVEMATRSRTMPKDGHRPVPLVTVLVGYETLHGRICELAGGAVVTPGSLLAYLDEALIERVVFRPGQRAEVGAAARLFSGATRRAIEVRDRQCTHPYCDVPVQRCQVDHIVPFSQGGPTTQENGRLLCGFHNRLRNQRPPPPESDEPAFDLSLRPGGSGDIVRNEDAQLFIERKSNWTQEADVSKESSAGLEQDMSGAG